MVSFDDIFELPFFLDKSSDSVLRRYIEAHNEEVTEFGDKLDEVIESRQIDNAEGDELDRIGASFGVLGERRGRDDQEYRIYLKSLVQSFKGRGTVPGIVSAVAAALNTDEANIEIKEDFENVEYTISLSDWPPHRGSTVQELAELADASVARLAETEYNTGEDEVSVDDGVAITVSTQVAFDELSVDDFATANENKSAVTDSTGVSDEAVARRRGVESVFTAGDTPGVNDNQTQTTDVAGFDDTATTAITQVAWDTGDWDTMYWAKNR